MISGLSCSHLAKTKRRERVPRRPTTLRIGRVVQPSVEPSMRPNINASMAGAEECRPDGIDRIVRRRLIVREELDGRDQPDKAEDDVDQEHRAPIQTGDVGRNDEPGHDRSENG